MLLSGLVYSMSAEEGAEMLYHNGFPTPRSFGEEPRLVDETDEATMPGARATISSWDAHQQRSSPQESHDARLCVLQGQKSARVGHSRLEGLSTTMWWESHVAIDPPPPIAQPHLRRSRRMRRLAMLRILDFMTWRNPQFQRQLRPSILASAEAVSLVSKMGRTNEENDPYQQPE
jgi:hypothetical protein